MAWNGEDFQARREAASVTREQIAVALCVTVTSVYRWESGRSTPHELFRRALEAALVRLARQEAAR